MSYTCKDCGKHHSGFPDYAFAYPEEYLDLGEEEKRRKTKRISQNVIYIKNAIGYNFYVHTFYPQKVQGAEEPWMFKVWVRVRAIDIKRLGDLRNEMFFTGTLHSILPWYDEAILGYPVRFQYDEGTNEMMIVDIYKENNKLYNDFTNGMPTDLALDWVKTLMQNVVETDCSFKSKI